MDFVKGTSTYWTMYKEGSVWSSERMETLRKKRKRKACHGFGGFGCDGFGSFGGFWWL